MAVLYSYEAPFVTCDCFLGSVIDIGPVSYIAVSLKFNQFELRIKQPHLRKIIRGRTAICTQVRIDSSNYDESTFISVCTGPSLFLVHFSLEILLAIAKLQNLISSI